MKLTYKQHHRPRIELTNLIDVMFFMLIFFMLFTTFRPSQAGLELNLPQATSAQNEVVGDVVLSVTSKELYWGDIPVNLNNLGIQVATWLAENPEARFIIKADKDILYERLVAVIDVVRQHGGSRVALAVKPLAEKADALEEANQSEGVRYAN